MRCYQFQAFGEGVNGLILTKKDFIGFFAHQSGTKELMCIFFELDAAMDLPIL
jgi:hypothetical protein